MFMWVLFKVLEWSFISALVLTYVEIGPGGENLGAIVQAIKSVLVTVDWQGLTHSILDAIHNAGDVCLIGCEQAR